MIKYKSRVTGKEIVIDDNYTNCNGVIPLITALYDNSNEWVQTFPINENNINRISILFVEQHCKGGTFSKEYKQGMTEGIRLYIESLANER